MEIEHGYWRWKIYRWDRHPNPFRGRRDLALNWLRRFETDRRVMSELRQLLAEARSDALARATDRQVLEDIAIRISTGEFHVCAESSHPFYQDKAEVKIPGPTSDEEIESVTPAPAPAPASSTPPPAPAEATLPENADAARIADALKEAAQTGVPFCEECQKSAASTPANSAPMPAASGSASSSGQGAEAQRVIRSATPADEPVPVSEGGASPNLDPAQTASNLRQASATGSTFCEESQRSASS